VAGYIGIDPGQSGGIAALDDEGRVLLAAKLAERTDVEILNLLSNIAVNAMGDGLVLRAVIEQVHSMPSQGVASSFTFGTSYGALRMALAARAIPYELVSPAKWQKVLGCRSGGDKNVTKRRAQELFPSLKVTHAIADALLLAEFCRRLEVRSVSGG